MGYVCTFTICSSRSPIYYQIHISDSSQEISKMQTLESSFWVALICARSIPKIELASCTSKTFRSNSSYHGRLAFFPRFFSVQYQAVSCQLILFKLNIGNDIETCFSTRQELDTTCRILTMKDLNTRCAYISQSIQDSFCSHHIPYLITNFLFLAHSSKPGMIRVEDRSCNLSARNISKQT